MSDDEGPLWQDYDAAMRCPSCATLRHFGAGPVFKPRRWFRRKPRWRCVTCKYEWAANDFTAADLGGCS